MISIIIPAYNAEQYIGRSLECCLKQTYPDLEIIVVNDGSQDSTSDIVRDLQLKDSRIKLVEKENGGLVSARKEALLNVSGDFVFFLDADDLIEFNSIEMLAKYCNDYDIIIADFLLENDRGKVLPNQHSNRDVYGGGKIGTLCNYLSKSITASLCGRLIRTSLLEDFATPLDVTTGEDVITNLLIVSKHKPRLKVVNVPLYHYIQYPHSMVNTKNKKTLMKRISYAQWVLDFISAEGLVEDENVKPQLAHLLLDEYYSFLRDGGKFEYCHSFCKKINSFYWSKSVVAHFPVWKRMMLLAYHLGEKPGILVRNILNSIRFVIK